MTVPRVLRRLLPPLAWGAFAVSAQAQPASTAVTNASFDPGDPHVVAIQHRSLTCGPGTVPDCTGTLVAPRVVLTAAHCVDNGPPEGVQVFFGSDVDAPGEVLYVVDLQLHPLFDPVTLANDLAVLVLPVASPHPPAPLLTDLDPGAVGALVRVVGFGADGADGAPGLKRTGAATVSAISDASFEIAPSPSMSCNGDSGGPVFLEVDGVEYLAGVTSSGDATCVSYGENVRVDTQLAGFLQPAIDAVSGMPEAPDGDPIVPGTDAVCGAPCQGDGDCPTDHTCSEREDGRLCRYEGLPNGFLDGTACDDPGACPSGWCVAVERGGRPECVCYTTCEVAEEEVKKGGCGCASTPYGANVTWLGLALAALRRRYRIEANTA